MYKKIVASGLTASVMFLAVGCQFQSNTNKIVEPDQWKMKTGSFIQSSYMQKGQIGGFFDDLPMRQTANDLDINSTAWYLSSLEFLGKQMAWTTEEKATIEQKLKEIEKNPPTQYATLYDDWCMIHIYKEVGLQIPTSLKDAYENYVQKNSDHDGWMRLSDKGLNNNSLTLIRIRIDRDLGNSPAITNDTLQKKIKQDLADENNNDLNFDLLIAKELQYQIDKSVLGVLKQNYTSVFANWNWKEDNTKKFDDIFVGKEISDFLSVKFPIPDDVVAEYVGLTNDSIQNKQRLDGSLLYEWIYLFKDQLDRNKLYDYVTKISNDYGLWGTSFMKNPKIKDTYYALYSSDNLLLKLNDYTINGVTNLYKYSVSSKSFSANDAPYLFGIGLWLEDKGISVDELPIVNYIHMVENGKIEQESDFYFLLSQIYKLNNKPIDQTLRTLENDIVSKTTTFDYLNHSLQDDAGIVEANFNQNKIRPDQVLAMTSKFSKTNGYANITTAKYPDLVGTYYALLMKEAIGSSLDDQDKSLLSNFKGKLGYVLYSKIDNWYSLEFTYDGVILNGMLNQNK